MVTGDVKIFRKSLVYTGGHQQLDYSRRKILGCELCDMDDMARSRHLQIAGDQPFLQQRLYLGVIQINGEGIADILWVCQPLLIVHECSHFYHHIVWKCWHGKIESA